LKTTAPTVESVFQEYKKGLDFNTQIGLNETVENNENFYIGKQWEGVTTNGLPTFQDNFLKPITQFIVASIISDNITLQCSPLSRTGDVDRIADIVNREFVKLFEINKIGTLIREYMRNATVDGDGCMFTWFDPDEETGQLAKGAIKTEIIENTRVFFGNPNDRRVQRQPYIIIATRELVDDVKQRAEDNGIEDTSAITADTDDNGSTASSYTSDKCTVLLRLWRDRKTKTIHAYECTQKAEIKPAWDLGIKLYPITWLPWDYVRDCYHGQALITGLIPNQVFVNKAFAMTELSLMNSAFPKTVYDKTRINKWTNGVGQAVGINGGDVNSVAKNLEPAQISPQVAQFIELAESVTKSNLGATPAAMGQTRPDNTSAIIALQRAAAIPSELTKRNLYQTIEDLGRIYIEFMGENYGERIIEIATPDDIKQEAQLAGVKVPDTIQSVFDFSVLKTIPMSLSLDVGASAYWSEIATLQTLDNLLMQNKINVVQYLERLPDYSITDRQGLIDELKSQMVQMPVLAPGEAQPGQIASTGQPPPIPEGAGYGAMQRRLNETGVLN
jgi:hypothetical protein